MVRYLDCSLLYFFWRAFHDSFWHTHFIKVCPSVLRQYPQRIKFQLKLQNYSPNERILKMFISFIHPTFRPTGNHGQFGRNSSTNWRKKLSTSHILLTTWCFCTTVRQCLLVVNSLREYIILRWTAKHGQGIQRAVRTNSEWLSWSVSNELGGSSSKHGTNKCSIELNKSLFACIQLL
jgi:hypothetical protein